MFGERQQLEAAIGALETQRAALGNAVVDTALAFLSEKLAALDAKSAHAPQQLKQVTVLLQPNLGLRRFISTMGAMSSAEGPFAPGLWRYDDEKVNSRRYLRLTSNLEISAALLAQ
jgi:hypothetical protein